MPQIKEYATPALGLHVTETGATATAAAARRVGAEYNEAGSSIAAGGQAIAHASKLAGDAYVNYQDHQEISRGAPAFAGLMSSKTDEWNKISNDSDPNDPAVAKKFVEENLNPALDKFKEGFTTEKSQQWAESHIDAFRNHMFVKTSADMASNAGRAAEVNVHQTINSMSNTVRNDPTSLDFTLQTYESSLNGMVDSSPNLKGTEGGKIKTALMQHGNEEIVKSAALGHIEKTGEIPDWISDPKYSKYIKPGELKQLQQAEKNYRSLHNSETRSAQFMREHAMTTDFNQNLLDLKIESLPKNDGDPPTPPKNWGQRLRDLARHPGAALPSNEGKITAAENQFAGMARRIDKPEPLAPISHANTIELTRRMRSDGSDRLTDDKPIWDKFNDGGLTKGDLNFALKTWQEMRTPSGEALNHERGEFFKRYEEYMNPGALTGARDREGQERMYRAEVAARREEENVRRAGRDPHEVYNPDSPDFFGRPGNIQKYAAPKLQTQLRNEAAKIFNDRFGNIKEPSKEAADKFREAATSRPDNAPQPTPDMPTARNKKEFDALEPGTRFLGDDGRVYRKPEKAQR